VTPRSTPPIRRTGARRTAVAAAAFTACAALAQVPQPAAPQPQPQPERTLRPVVVTPTPGIAQPGFDTPASVDVIDAATLHDAQLQVNLSETLARVPGVVALNRQNYAQDLQISIRGFGARSTFGVRGLRLFTDGIPATAPDGQGQVSHFDLASADRVEVLRGPFSALYGNSSGGVISLFTADGAPGRQLETNAAVGSDGIRRENLRFAGDEGAWNWNASATHFATQGFREHSAAQRGSFNGKLRWKASGDTRITFVGNAVDLPGVQDPLGLTRAEFQANPRQASPAAAPFDTRKSVQQQQLGAILEQRLTPAQGLKLTTWRGQRATEQFQAIPVAAQAAPTSPGGVIELGRVYQGLDAQWIYQGRVHDNPLTVTAGVHADDLQEHRQGFQNFVGGTLGVQGALRRDEDNRVRSLDQYAQANWDSERFGLSAGLRHSIVHFGSRDRYVVAGNPDDSGAARYEATTPILGAVYHVGDRMNLYAAAGRGFETPTLNEIAYRASGQTGLNFGLQPATSRQFEVGVKAEPVRDWRIDAALFQANTGREIVVLSNTGGRTTFQNASSTRRRGLEAALTGQWGTGWSTYAALTWLDARYRSAFLTCVAAPCAAPATQVPAGNRMPGIPRVSAYAELAWRWRPWGLETALELRHVGRMAVDDLNSDFAPAATTWNARLALAQNVGRWALREFLRVDNLADRRTIGSVIVDEGNRRFFEPAPGRSWLVGASALYKF
jgi:iron complex outermembrane recepter protein